MVTFVGYLRLSFKQQLGSNYQGKVVRIYLFSVIFGSIGTAVLLSWTLTVCAGLTVVLQVLSDSIIDTLEQCPTRTYM